MSEWIEGEWDGDKPVEPPEWDFVWYITNEKWSRVQVVSIDGLSLCLRTVLIYRRQKDPDAKPPRWWWIGIQQPPHLPSESARGKRRAEIDKKYAEEHCVKHDLLLPCEECEEYCSRHGLLMLGGCQDCIDEEVYG